MQQISNGKRDSIKWWLSARLLKLIVLLGLVAILSFILVSFSPIDPVNAYVGADMMLISQEQKVIIAKRWGLDQSLATRFLKWAGQISQGNFGTSTIYHEPVFSVIGKRFMTSLWLMAIAWGLSGILGLVLGMIAGMTEGSLVDRAIRLYSYTLASTPTFWMAIVLLMIFSVVLQWTPICGAIPIGVMPEDVTIWQRIHHLILPALALSIIGVANIVLHTREKIVDIIHGDFVLFAKAQGDTRFGIAWFHVLRNIILPAITLQFASLGELFGGSALAEQVFAYPGLGKATVEAGVRGDVPLLLGIVLFSTVFVFTGNTIADLLYRLIDPRIHVGENTHEAGASL